MYRPPKIHTLFQICFWKIIVFLSYIPSSHRKTTYSVVTHPFSWSKFQKERTCLAMSCLSIIIIIAPTYFWSLIPNVRTKRRSTNLLFLVESSHSGMLEDAPRWAGAASGRPKHHLGRRLAERPGGRWEMRSWWSLRNMRKSCSL